MATPALTHSDLDSSLGSMHIAEIYSGSLAAALPHETEDTVSQSDAGRLSTRSALGGARGAMVALALEAAAGAGVFCIYEIFRHAIFHR
jgi:hypothetical protein